MPEKNSNMTKVVMISHFSLLFPYKMKFSFENFKMALFFANFILNILIEFVLIKKRILLKENFENLNKVVNKQLLF